MFHQASVFNQHFRLNTSSVTNMSSMFRGALVFNQDIGAWDVSGVTNMEAMLLDAGT